VRISIFSLKEDFGINVYFQFFPQFYAFNELALLSILVNEMSKNIDTEMLR
jgi:hypothetical protein